MTGHNTYDRTHGTVIIQDQTHPGIKRVLAVPPRNHIDDYQTVTPVAIIHKHYLYDKATYVAACTTVYFDTMGCFSIVKNVQFQFCVCFNAEQTSMQKNYHYRNALRFAIEHIVPSPVFSRPLLTTHMFKE